MKSQSGSKRLLVTGILMIISVIINIFPIINLLGHPMELFLKAKICNTYFTLAIASIIFMIIAGILGIKYWDKLEKANLCITFCNIHIVGNILATALNITIIPYGADPFSVVSLKLLWLAFSLIIPLLYISGAKQNRQALKQKYADTIQKTSETEVS